MDKKKRILVQTVDAIGYLGYIVHSAFTFRWLQKKRPIKKVLVYNVGLIGDTLLSLSTLKALKDKFKDLTVVTSNPSLLKGYNTITFAPSWIKDEKKQYFKFSDIKEIHKFTKKIKKQKFDLAIDLRGDIRNLGILYLTKIPRRIGYAITGGKYFLTTVVPFKGGHEVEKKLDIARYLGCSIQTPFPQLRVSKKDSTCIQALLKKNKITSANKKIVILPSTGYWTKLWDNTKWARVIESLLKNKKTKIILLGGPNEEHFGEIKSLIKRDQQRVFNWIGRLKLLETAALLKEADVLISPDNGIMHMAAALGTPTISLFGPTLPDRWGPYGKIQKNHKIIYNQQHCSPCGKLNSCPFNKECMTSIQPQDIINEVKNAGLL